VEGRLVEVVRDERLKGGVPALLEAAFHEVRAPPSLLGDVQSRTTSLTSGP
jgi:hypothetical protein